MKALKFFSIIWLFYLLCFPSNLLGQYQGKYAFTLSEGFLKPIGNLGSYFKFGVSTDIGMEYSLYNSFSIDASLHYITFVASSNYIQTTYDNVGISLFPKYWFNVGSKFSSYVIGGPTFNFVKLNTGIDSVFHDYKAPVCLGYLIGAGGNISFNPKISLFSQAGYNSTFFKDGEYKNTIQNIFLKIGVHFNL